MANKNYSVADGKLYSATAARTRNAPARPLAKHELARNGDGLLNTTSMRVRTINGEKFRNCARNRAGVIARTALFCRQRGFMKDLPALLAHAFGA